MSNKYVHTVIMSVRNYLLVVCFTEKRKSNFFFVLAREVCLSKCELSSAYYWRFLCKAFFHKEVENLYLPSSIIICCTSIWPRYILTVTSLSKKSCFHRTKCTFFCSCFSWTQQVLSCECGIGACCEKYILLARLKRPTTLKEWELKRGAAFAAHDPQEDCEGGHHSFFTMQRSSPNFGNLSSSKSCLGSPNLPHHLRRKYSPSDLLETSCSALHRKKWKIISLTTTLLQKWGAGSILVLKHAVFPKTLENEVRGRVLERAMSAWCLLFLSPMMMETK